MDEKQENQLGGIKAKLGLIIVSISACIILFAFFVNSNIRRADQLSEQIHHESASINQCALRAIQAAEKVISRIQEIILEERIEGFVANKENIDINIEKFEMFVKALIWGTKSSAFQQTKGGKLYSVWKKQNLDEDILIENVPNDIRQKAGEIDILFSGFTKHSKKALEQLDQSILLSKAGKSSVTRQYRREAYQSLKRAKTFAGLIREKIEELRTISEEIVGDTKVKIAGVQYKRNKMFLIFGSTIFVVLMGITIFIINREFVAPIQSMSEQISEVGKGDFKNALQTKKHLSNEILHLYNQFNQMMEGLRTTTVTKDQMTSIINSMLGSLVVLDPQFRIKTSNKGTRTMLGYDEEQLIGKPIDIILDGGLKEIQVSESLPGGFGSRSPFERYYVSKDGKKIPVLFSISMLKNRDFSIGGYICVAFDTSEIKNLQDQLRQSQKMEAIGTLASGVAHEINNPLGIILGFAQSLKSLVGKNQEMEMAVSFIEKESIRCKDLVQNLLVFSRRSKEEKLEETDLLATVQETLSLVSTQSQVRGIQLVREFEPNLPRIRADKNQIQQIIINLCNNGMDVMGKNGKLTVRTARVKKDSRDMINLSISDTGCGMSESVKKKIFEPFFTTKDVGKGTGLGLSLVYEIVQKHKGKIEVESEVGKGTTFNIFFPVNSEEQKQAA